MSLSDPTLAPRTAEAPSLIGRRVTVMGLGLFGGGVGAARWLAREGARVIATDLRDAETLAPALTALEGSGVEVHLGEHSARDFEGAELVVANPAVSPSNPWLRRARAAGVPVTSEVALFLERCPAPIAAVTGTQGKSSTSTWLAAFLAPIARRVHLGGNIGGSLLEALGTIDARDRVVLELSSYQLEALPPRATQHAREAHARETPARETHAQAALPRALSLAIVTNVLADHLERHGDVAEYARAKARILELVAPGGAALLPRSLAGRPPFHRAAELRLEVLVHDGNDAREPGVAPAAMTLSDGRFHVFGEDLGPTSAVRVPGRFQHANVLVALGAARRLGVPVADLVRLVPTLVGLPHRVEDLGVRKGVRVIDNGVSTTPDSTVAALEGLPGAERLPLTVLLGGAAKRDLALGALAAALASRGALAIVFGAASEALAAACSAAGARVERTPDVLAAAARGLAATPHGGTLLFSPACASFDAWPNFEARAQAFRASLPPEDSDTAEDSDR